MQPNVVTDATDVHEEFDGEPKRGYRELRGYSNTANPWREERYNW